MFFVIEASKILYIRLNNVPIVVTHADAGVTGNPPPPTENFAPSGGHIYFLANLTFGNLEEHVDEKQCLK